MKPLSRPGAVRLGVNIDHVATVRQARRGVYPDPVQAAVLAAQAGADQITAHLRADRRHVQERDIRAIRDVAGIPLNMEIAPTQEMLDIVLDVKPHQVTLVPEQPDELTTEGGLNIAQDPDRYRQKVSVLTELGIHVAVFIDPDADQIKAAHRLGVQAIEFCTREYAHSPDAATMRRQLGRLDSAARLAAKVGLGVYAGHDLNLRNLGPVAAIGPVEELNIGHALVGRAVLVGFAQAVKDYTTAIADAAVAKE